MITSLLAALVTTLQTPQEMTADCTSAISMTHELLKGQLLEDATKIAEEFSTVACTYSRKQNGDMIISWKGAKQLQRDAEAIFFVSHDYKSVTRLKSKPCSEVPDRICE